MNTLGPGMGPGSKLDLSQQMRELKPNPLRELKPDAGVKPHDLGERKGFADLVRERTPVKNDAGSRIEDSRSESSKRDKTDEPGTSDRQNDSRPVKVESKGKSSKDAMNATEKADVRKKAMLKFMDSMENEFGITPARMLEAMAQIDSEEMTLAPQDTATQVIENLDLPQEDQAQAMALYSSFINQWRELQDNRAPEPVPISESLPMLGAGAGGFHVGREAIAAAQTAGKLQAPVAGPAPVKTEAMLKAEEQLRARLMAMGENPATTGMPMTAQEKTARLNESLDQMNAKFFARPESRLTEAQVLPANLMTQNAGANTSTNATAATTASKTLALENLPTFTQDESGLYAGRATSEGALNFGQLPGLMPGKAEVASDFFGSKAATVGAKEGESALAALMAEVKATSPSGGEASDSESFGSESGREASSLDRGSQDLSRTDMARGDFGQMLKPMGLQASAAMAAGGSLTATSMTAADHKEALEALKDQTQIMVDKGGGEAKVTFNQEGLGEISLKVTVRDGKVNVEMGAETQEAKKLIESSIGDLKASLSQHKLAVEGVRVDVGSSGLSDSNKQQSGMNFGQDMGRDQARQMMQQFRDDTAGRRDPFFEMSGIRAYAQKMPGPAPIAPASDRAVSRYAGKGRGTSMNLVA